MYHNIFINCKDIFYILKITRINLYLPSMMRVNHLFCFLKCDKIRKKRGAFLGSLRIAHTTSFDETDSKILAAR